MRHLSVNKWIHDRETLERASGSGLKRKHTDEQNKIIHEYVKVFMASKISLPSPLMAVFLSRSLEDHPLFPSLKEEPFTDREVRRILRSLKYSYRRATRTATKKEVDGDIMDDFFSRCFYVVHEHSLPPSRVFNLDETPLVLVPSGKQRWAGLEKGWRHAGLLDVWQMPSSEHVKQFIDRGRDLYSLSQVDSNAIPPEDATASPEDLEESEWEADDVDVVDSVPPCASASVASLSAPSTRLVNREFFQAVLGSNN